MTDTGQRQPLSVSEGARLLPATGGRLQSLAKLFVEVLDRFRKVPDDIDQEHCDYSQNDDKFPAHGISLIGNGSNLALLPDDCSGSVGVILPQNA